eukprot:Gb_25976 [translate_table: standard]
MHALGLEEGGSYVSGSFLPAFTMEHGGLKGHNDMVFNGSVISDVAIHAFAMLVCKVSNQMSARGDTTSNKHMQGMRPPLPLHSPRAPPQVRLTPCCYYSRIEILLCIYKQKMSSLMSRQPKLFWILTWHLSLLGVRIILMFDDTQL